MEYILLSQHEWKKSIVKTLDQIKNATSCILQQGFNTWVFFSLLDLLITYFFPLICFHTFPRTWCFQLLGVSKQYMFTFTDLLNTSPCKGSHVPCTLLTIFLNPKRTAFTTSFLYHILLSNRLALEKLPVSFFCFLMLKTGPSLNYICIDFPFLFRPRTNL